MRIGLVLGGGGFAGYAYHAGVLAGLEAATGWRSTDADLVVGTSAGAGVGALVRSGVPGSDLAALIRGEAVSSTSADVLDRIFGADARPRDELDEARRRRRLRMASPAAAARHLSRPWRARWGTVLAGVLPEGPVAIEEMTSAFSSLTWPARPLWICAVRLEDGRRVVFGRDRDADLGAAVAASSAIPGLFRPVRIHGRRYVDGGAHSPTNLDLLAGAPPLDLAIVISPLSSRGRVPVRIDAATRVFATRRLAQERRRVRDTGTPLLVVQPGPADLRAMGPNPMDPRRVARVAEQAERSTLQGVDHGRVRPLLDLLAKAAVKPAAR